MPSFGDWTGKKHGRLTFQWPTGRNKFAQIIWLALCDCGVLVHVTKRQAKSCGCLHKERASEANKHAKSEETKQLLSIAASRKETPHVCRTCGKEFLGRKAQKFCGRRCQKAFFETRGSSAGRALRNGAKAEAVAFWKVYERDGGICQVCQQVAPRALRGDLRNRLAPTLGHIVPLARGGDHTYANVQLEHLCCNLAKGDTLPEGAVEPKTNPDPRTRSQKISDGTRKAMARPDIRQRFLEGNAKRNLSKPRPAQAEAMKQAWARGTYKDRQRRITVSMTKASMDAQTRTAANPSGFQPIGAAAVDNVDVADAQDTQAPPTQAPQTLPIAEDTKQNNASTNDGGKTQTPITGWVNSKKVVATYNGKEGSLVDFGDATANSASVVAIKP